MLKYKHIEAAREARLWIGQIVVPLCTAYVMVHPDAVDRIVEAPKKVVNKVKNVFK